MRILIVHGEYRESGGEEIAVQQLVRCLKETGHDVRVFKKKNSDWDGWSVWQKFLSVLSIPFSYRNYRELKEHIRTFQPHIIHVHNIFPFITPSVYKCANDCQVPVVQTLHNYRFFCINGLLFRNGKTCELCLRGGVWNGALFRCFQKSYPKSALMALSLLINRLIGTWNRRIQRILALSQFSEGKFMEAGLNRQQIQVLPNPIRGEGPLLRNVPSSLGFVYVGRLSVEKGVDTLLLAFREFSKSHPEVPLHVIGDGPLMPKVVAFKEKNPSLPLRIHGAKYGKEKEKICKKSSFLVFPSECYENCPYAILESFACGTPVIASNIGGIPELVEEGKTGYLFDAGSSDSLVQAMSRAGAQSSHWLKMSQRCGEVSKIGHSEKQWTRELDKIYQSLLPGDASPTATISDKK